MRIIMAGAAAIALAASGAYAQGNGKGNGGGKSATQANGNGSAGGKKADRGPQRSAQPDRQQQRGNGNRDVGNNNRGNRGNGNADRGPDRAVQGNRSNGSNGNSGNSGNGGKADRRDVRVQYDIRDDRRILGGDRDRRWLTQDRTRGLINGCPPGLAKKRNGCNPPGQVKDRYARSPFGSAYRPGLFGLSNYDTRGGYSYNDGYLVRYADGGGIASWIPLLGGALGIGNVWPSSYQSYSVPDYYVDYYNLGGADRYRYADNVIYRIDPEDQAITSIAALITGDDIRVGQAMPAGYDVYNVPYAYRDRYADTAEYNYRYSDGYVYQVDPETQLVAAAIDLLI